MRDRPRLQVPPLRHPRSKPFRQLLPDRLFQPGIRRGVTRPRPCPRPSGTAIRRVDHRHADQGPAGRGVTRRHVAGDTQVVDRPGTGSVQHQQAIGQGGSLGRVRQTGRATRPRGLDFPARKPRRGGAFHRQHHPQGVQPLTRLERHSIRSRLGDAGTKSQALRRQGRRQLSRDRPHPLRRDARRAGAEHVEHELKKPARSRQFAFKEHPCEPGLQELRVHLGRDPDAVEQEVAGAQFGGGLRSLPGVVPLGQHPAPQLGEPEAIAQCANPVEQGPHRPERVPPRVEHFLKAAGSANERPGVEGAEPQAGVIEHRLRLGIGGLQHLEAMIEPMSIDQVGADASPHLGSRLEDQHGETRLHQSPRAAQPRQPRTHHHHAIRHVQHQTTHKKGTEQKGVILLFRLRRPPSGPRC